MAISRTRVFSSSNRYKTTFSQNIGESITKFDYVIVHVLTWDRTSATEPSVSSITLADSIYPTRTITLTEIASQTRNEAIAKGGWCTIKSYGGQYIGDAGDISSGSITITLNVNTEYIFTHGAIYRGVPYDYTLILGEIDTNNGDGTTHDYGSVSFIWPNPWLHSYIVIWDTTSNVGSYIFDEPSGFTTLVNNDEESTPGTNHRLFMITQINPIMLSLAVSD